MNWDRRLKIFLFLLALLPTAIVQLSLFQKTEPFFNNDETRHFMTGIFFHDFLKSGDYLHPKEYATQYYLQYPALGLLVWPPGLHVAEGFWFLLWGPTFLAGRILVELFFVISSLYLFRLIVRTSGLPLAFGTVFLFGLLPAVVPAARHIMGEVPTLAWILASLFHFERYIVPALPPTLEEIERNEHLRPKPVARRVRDVWLACLFAALAALTRFDAVLLLPYFFGRLVMTRQLSLLKNRAVIGGILLALGLTAPYYYLTWKEYGTAVAKAASEGTVEGSTSLFALSNLFFYPSQLPKQISWFLLLPALVGFLVSWLPFRLDHSAVWRVLVIAVYLTFTPLAELDSRHTIYWLPAWAYFSVYGFFWLCSAAPELTTRVMAIFLGGIVVLGGLLYTTWIGPNHYVFGYREAAEYVVEHSEPQERILIDAFLNGGFIADVRLLDPQRGRTVLRGDKIFYGMISDPHGGYQDFAQGPDEIAQRIFDYDPAYIVVEQPQLYFDLPGAQNFREAIRKYADRFELVKTVEIRSNRTIFEDARLEIYKNRKRNPNPMRDISLPMLNLGKTLGTPPNPKE